MAGVRPGENITGEDIQNYFRSKRSQDNRSEHVGNNTSTGLRSEVPRNGGQRSKCDSLGNMIDKPKYRQYCTTESRIKSFEKWPEGKTQDTKQLAEAGFAYAGVDDSVRCFYCSIGLRDWPDGACPWEQHVLASQECGYVIHCKGKAYIRKILGESYQDPDEDAVKEAIKRNAEAVFAVREFCEDEKLIKRAIKSLIKHNIQKQISAVDLMKVIQEIIEGNTERTGTTSEAEEDIGEINRKLKDRVTCKICFGANVCIVTLPCGHLVSCSQCISALTKCAVCRAKIERKVRALMAV